MANTNQTGTGTDPLWESTKIGDAAKVKQLLDASNEPHTQDAHFLGKLLSVACRYGRLDVVNVLLSHPNINVNELTGSFSTSPLYIACAYCHEQVAAALIAKGCDVDLGDHRGITPLRIACEKGTVEIVRLLVDAGADVNFPLSNDRLSYSPLMLAALYGRIDCVKVLLAAGAKVETARPIDGYTALLYACTAGNVEVVRILSKALVSNESKSIVIASSSAGHTCLTVAAQFGHANIVSLLLSRQSTGVNWQTSTGETALYFAAQNGHLDVVLRLLRVPTIEVDLLCSTNSETALCCAVKAGHTHIIKALLASGASMYAEDRYGHTILYYAARKGNSRLVRLFITLLKDDNTTTFQTKFPKIAIEGIMSKVAQQYNTFDYRRGLVTHAPWTFSDKMLFLNGWTLVAASKEVLSVDYRTFNLYDPKMMDVPVVVYERNRLLSMLEQLGGLTAHDRQWRVASAIAVDNPGLRFRFENCLEAIADRHRSLPEYFCAKWDKDDQKKNHVMKKFRLKIDSVEWNKTKKLPGKYLPSVEVMPVVHGTNPESVRPLCHTGFGIARKEGGDGGWYGQGIYFTSYLHYARRYSTGPTKTLIIGYAIPGNTFPVTEAHTNEKDSLLGKPVKAGYQSHYVAVARNGTIPRRYREDMERGFYDELVLPQDAQAIPKYVVVLDAVDVPQE